MNWRSCRAVIPASHVNIRVDFRCLIKIPVLADFFLRGSCLAGVVDREVEAELVVKEIQPLLCEALHVDVIDDAPSHFLHICTELLVGVDVFQGCEESL